MRKARMHPRVDSLARPWSGRAGGRACLELGVCACVRAYACMPASLGREDAGLGREDSSREGDELSPPQRVLQAGSDPRTHAHTRAHHAHEAPDSKRKGREEKKRERRERAPNTQQRNTA